MSLMSFSDLSCFVCRCIFLCKQKSAYDMRISDWSSDVCSSDLQSWFASGPSSSIRGRWPGSEPRLVARGLEARLLGATSAPSSARMVAMAVSRRSEERRVGKSVYVRVYLGGRRFIKQKTHMTNSKEQTE